MRAARTASRASAPGRAAGSSRAAGGPGRRAARTPRHGVLRRRTSAGDAVSSPVSGCQVVARRQDLPSARCRSPPGPGRAYASVASWRPVREARAAGQISGRRIVLVRGVVAAPMSHGSRPLLGAAIRCVPPMNAKNIHLALALALREAEVFTRAVLRTAGSGDRVSPTALRELHAPHQEPPGVRHLDHRPHARRGRPRTCRSRPQAGRPSRTATRVTPEPANRLLGQLTAGATVRDGAGPSCAPDGWPRGRSAEGPSEDGEPVHQEFRA